MRSSTVVSAAALTLVFLAVKSGPMQARAAVILPLILVKKHPLKHLKLIPVPLPLPLPIPIPIHKPKLLHLLLPKLPRIGITVHLGKHGHLPLHHLRLHHKPKLVHVDHHHHEPEFHASHHSSEDEVYEVKTPPQYPNKDWKS